MKSKDLVSKITNYKCTSSIYLEKRNKEEGEEEEMKRKVKN